MQIPTTESWARGARTEQPLSKQVRVRSWRMLVQVSQYRRSFSLCLSLSVPFPLLVSSLPPFRFLCTPTASAFKLSLPGEPASVAAWHEQLLVHQPHVGEGDDERVLYSWERNEVLETDERVVGFVAFYQSHPTFATPEVNLLTLAEIKKRQSPSPNASSRSSSKSNPPPRQVLPPSASGAGSVHGSSNASSASQSAPSSVSTLDWATCTLSEFLTRQAVVRGQQAAMQQLDDQLIPDLRQIVNGLANISTRYPDRSVADILTMLATVQDPENRINGKTYKPGQ
jgi:hypothetical protein